MLKEVDVRALSGESKVFMEPRVSIYGQRMAEWSELAKWWKVNGLDKARSMKWMVQFPRLFALFQRTGAVKSFEEFLHNCRPHQEFVFSVSSRGRTESCVCVWLSQAFSHCSK
jgi:AMP deaminase